MARLSLILGVLALASLGSADYCSLCSGQHTLCVYSSNVASKCGKTLSDNLQRSVSDAEKQQILDKHNALRSTIAKGNDDVSNMPAAANMMKLEWDDELANIAQVYANQCIWGHDKCRLTSDGCYNSVGQNIAMLSSSASGAASNWDKAIQMWYDEIKDYQADWAEKFTQPSNGAVVGHFTQVVWATTHRIGCGYITFYESGWYKQHYVCNYAVGGNMMNAPVYMTGNACSQCPANSQCENTSGLCQLN